MIIHESIISQPIMPGICRAVKKAAVFFFYIYRLHDKEIFLVMVSKCPTVSGAYFSESENSL